MLDGRRCEKSGRRKEGFFWRIAKSVQLRASKVSPSGFEPLTFGFGGRHSIQLSYGDGGGSLEQGSSESSFVLSAYRLGVGDSTGELMLEQLVGLCGALGGFGFL